MRPPAAAILAAVCAGCSLTGSSDLSARPVVEVARSGPGNVRTTIVGGTARQRTVLREILAGLGHPRIRRVVIKRAGTDFTPHSPGAVGVVFSHGPVFRGRWESLIAGQAFVDRSKRDGLPDVAYFGVQGDMSRAAASRTGPGSPPTPSERAAVVEQLENDARRDGVELTTVRFVRPFASGVELTFLAERPARFLSQHWYDLSGHVAKRVRPRFPAGHLIDIRDRNGTPVLGAGALGETGGTSFIAKRYEGCTQTSLSVPLGYNPPPCPLESD